MTSDEYRLGLSQARMLLVMSKFTRGTWDRLWPERLALAMRLSQYDIQFEAECRRMTS